jgi:hypothetical protein
MIPRMTDRSVRNTDAEAIMEKNIQVVNVQRKVVEKNITPQPLR